MSSATRIFPLLAGLLLPAWGAPATAQSVDLGRGPVPVTVPAGYDPGVPTPLIVLLHGYTSNGAGQDRYMGFGSIADDYRFLLVAPDGTRETAGDRARFWNASEACCNFQGSEVDDVDYLMRLIDQVASEWNVDPLRVHLVGHSNGGFMSYRMAREHPGTIAAIASLAGAEASGTPTPPASPVSILQIHGTDDEVIEYQGGTIGKRDPIRYPSARTTVGRWASWNGCEGAGVGREMRDLDASLPGHETGALVFVAGCAPGGDVALWTISGGGHSPPLSDDFAAQVVEWLLAHPRPARD